MHFKRIASAVCVLVLCLTMISIPAAAKSSDEIQDEIESYESELSDSEAESESLNAQISDLQQEVGSLVSDVEQMNVEMESYRESMSTRIQYFYEESLLDSVFEAILGAKSFADFVNRMDYLQSIYEYDQEQMNEYETLISETEEKQDELNERIDEMSALLEEQESIQDSLKGTISGKQSELTQAQEAEAEAEAKAKEEAEAKAKAEAEAEAEAKAKAEEEEKAKAEEEELVAAAKTTVDETSKSSEKSSEESSSKKSSKKSSSKSSSESSGKSSGGALTRSKGVVYYNGHRETWYSQRVLPGGGLNIPGRHVDSDGLIRDGDGYICVASSDYPRGTIVETSLGTGKVYDSGCASGTIDIYTDW